MKNPQITRAQVLENCCSMANPGKSYGSINKGMEVMAYRNARIDYHQKASGNIISKEVREAAQVDVIAKYGHPF